MTKTLEPIASAAVDLAGQHVAGPHSCVHPGRAVVAAPRYGAKRVPAAERWWLACRKSLKDLSCPRLLLRKLEAGERCLNRIGAALQPLPFRVRQIRFDDALDAVFPNNTRQRKGDAEFRVVTAYGNHGFSR